MENGKTEKKFNTTVTAFFDAPEFGQDATGETHDSLVVDVTTRAGKNYKKEMGTAFVSAPLNADAFAAIKTAKPGDRLLLRKGKGLNKSGGRNFFLEVLPGLNNTNNTDNNTESDI
jgi:hypothetical protein